MTAAPTDDELRSRIWRLSTTENDPVKNRQIRYFRTALDDSLEFFDAFLHGAATSKLRHAKALTMSLWMARQHLNKMNSSAVGAFDAIFPGVKTFRDALAHLDERADEQIRVPKSKGPVAAAWEGSVTSFCGGTLVHAGGSVWNVTAATVDTIDISDQGLFTGFGLIDDYVITCDSNGLVEIDLSEQRLNALRVFLDSTFPAPAASPPTGQ